MITIGQDQKNAGPPRPMPTPKLPNDPVDTLMKLNAIAKLDRNPSVRFSSGLIPRDRRWAPSRAATSALLPGPDTASSLYHRDSAWLGCGARVRPPRGTRGTPPRSLALSAGRA